MNKWEESKTIFLRAIVQNKIRSHQPKDLINKVSLILWLTATYMSLHVETEIVGLTLIAISCDFKG